MFSATVELIGLISSSTLFMFGFCNLIIFILIVSNWKSNTPRPHYETSSCVTVIPKRIENDQIQENEPVLSIDIEASSDMVVEVLNVDREQDNDDQIQEDEPLLSIDIEASSDMVVEVPNVDGEEDNDDEDVKNDDDQEDEDELRRKVEAFIEKINRSWKEEKLGISPYVQREQPYGHLASTLVM